MACTDPDAIEAARVTGHARYLELFDPDHPDYLPERAAKLKPIVAAIARGPAPASPPGRRRPPVRPKCPARESCGCQWPRCHDPERGPRFGRPELVTLSDGSAETIYRVQGWDCERCGGVSPP